MMAFEDRKGRFNILGCCFVISLFLVNRTIGISLKSAIRGVISVNDVEKNDNDIKRNFGEHLENSVKNVEKNLTANALKMICRMLSCSDWSAWTACGSVIGRHGTRSRARTCGYDVTEACKEDMIGYDKDTSACIIHIPWCPLNYNYTRHGYCVKLYNNVFKSWYDAQIHCESDGGHLVNIDSKTLSDDIDEAFEDIEINSIYAWIDGIRRMRGNDWEFKSGLRTPKFSNWYGGHPREERFPTCKCMIRSGVDASFEWRSSYVCGNRENFICEIKKK